MAIWINGNQGSELYWLYLRPFQITRRVIVRENVTHLFGFLFERSIDFEEILEEAFTIFFGGQVFLITLGKSGEAVGAGRLEEKEGNWQESVRTLAHDSSGILVVPGTTEGIQWELELLRSTNDLWKAVFVMPPVTNDATARLRAGALSVLRSLGLENLKIGKKGALVRLSAELPDRYNLVTFERMNSRSLAAILSAI